MAAEGGSGQTAASRIDGVRIALYAATALVATILGLSLSVAVFGPGSETRRGGAFSLVDHTGRSVDQSLLEGQVSLVYFGFTHCPDICPTELVNMVYARELLRETGADAQVVFISVDPARDTPETLAEYVAAFGEDVIGLTGSAEAVAGAARAYEVIYAAAPPAPGYDPTVYDVVHSNYLYAVGPDARELWRFPGGTPPEVIVKRLQEVASLS